MALDIPAEVFPPGQFIADELEARGWSQRDLVEIIGRDANLVSAIIAGKRAITPETAMALASAFGTSADVWVRLECGYQLWRSYVESSNATQQAIARKSAIYELAPLREMIARNWIEVSENINVLEQRVCQFYGIQSIGEQPELRAVARKPSSYGMSTKSQIAWFFRAKRLANAVQAAPFNRNEFVKRLPSLRRLAADAENVRVVSKTLAEMGVRLVLLEQLSKTSIDGATLWTDSGPVIALSMRFDRLDAFWHTLGHELIHIKNDDGDSLDVAIVGDSTGKREAVEELPEAEIRANIEGAELWINADDLRSFTQRHKRRISEVAVIRFANSIQMHPGIIVGQLQHRGALPWTHLRKFLMQGKIRKMLMESTVTDGWGISPGVF